jgi:glutamate-ammonia-ligase adenylyltransferase
MSLPPLAELPAVLLPLVTRARQSWCSALESLTDEARRQFQAWPKGRLSAFDRVCAASDFVADQVSRDPLMLLDLAAAWATRQRGCPGGQRR